MKFLPINLKHIDISKNLTKKGSGGSTPVFSKNLNMMINKNKTDVVQNGEGMTILFLAIMLTNSHHINNNKIGNFNINNTNMNKDVSSSILKNINQENLNTILNKIQKIIQKDPELKNILKNLSKFFNVYIEKNITNLDKLSNIKKQNFILSNENIDLNLKDANNKNNNQIDILQLKKLIDLLKVLSKNIMDNKTVEIQENKNIQILTKNVNIQEFIPDPKGNLNKLKKNSKKTIKINDVKILNLAKKEELNNKSVNILNNEKNNFKNNIVKSKNNDLNLKEIFIQEKSNSTNSDIKQIEKLIGIDIKDKDFRHNLKELSNILKKLTNLSDGELEQKSYNIKFIKGTNKTNIDLRLHLNNDIIKLNPQVETIKSESSNISQDIRNNVLRQIEEGIFKNLGQGRRQISIKLHPPELGTLKLIMHMHNKEVSLVIHTQNHDVADGLNKHIANFEKSFEQQGLKLVKVEVKNDLFSGQESPWQNFQDTGKHGGAPSQRRKNFVSTALMGEKEIESMDPDGLRNTILKNQIYIVA